MSQFPPQKITKSNKLSEKLALKMMVTVTLFHGSDFKKQLCQEKQNSYCVTGRGRKESGRIIREKYTLTFFKPQRLE